MVRRLEVVPRPGSEFHADRPVVLVGPWDALQELNILVSEWTSEADDPSTLVPESAVSEPILADPVVSEVRMRHLGPCSFEELSSGRAGGLLGLKRLTDLIRGGRFRIP